MLRLIKLCFLGAWVAGLSACATPMVESVPLKSGETAVGLAYSVPKAQARLQISRRVVQAEEVERARNGGLSGFLCVRRFTGGCPDFCV
jgi:hypothetical protein